VRKLVVILRNAAVILLVSASALFATEDYFYCFSVEGTINGVDFYCTECHGVGQCVSCSQISCEVGGNYQTTGLVCEYNYYLCSYYAQDL